MIAHVAAAGEERGRVVVWLPTAGREGRKLTSGPDVKRALDERTGRSPERGPRSLS